MPTKTTKKTSATKDAPAKGRGRGRGKGSAASSEVVLSSTAPDTGNWVRVDLHLHTPGSHDYEQPDKSYLDILRQAERRGLRMIAFTDHNTVNGYRNMMREIEMFELLEKSDRIRPDELSRLVEYRRLLKKITVLPGFEFTATFGFHILGIFPPDKPVREIEHVLMQLKVPNEVIEKGLTEAGATSDVLTAYQLINAAGGIAIAAHANSSSGVSMRNMNLGGQTRIAFTQDPNLLAIEFTDLDKGPRRSSAYLFSGNKPEYPRRMHAIQGSDAHRVVGDPSNPKRLGVGDRTTELQLEDISFRGLRDLLSSQDFDKVRPAFDRLDLPPDMSDVVSAREAGASATIAFYPALAKKGDRIEAPLRDIAAMSNGDGGTIFLGCGDKTVRKTAGLTDARKVAAELTERLKTIKPQVSAVLAEVEVDGKSVLRINVLAGKNAPYALNEREFYLRKETESVLASRDELVALIKRALEAQRPASQQHQHGGRFQGREHREQRELREPREQSRPQHQGGNHQQGRQHEAPPQREPREQSRPQHQGGNQQPRFNGNQPGSQGQRGNQQGGKRGNQQGGNRNGQPLSNVGPLQLPKSLQGAALAGGRGKAESKVPDTPVDPVPQGAPRTGVQVLSMDERNGSIFFTVRDLRNNSVVRNVTMKSARDLWHYAISQYADNPGGPEDVTWQGNRSVIAGGVRAGKQRYDLVLRDDKGSTYVFYGVMQEGLDETWKSMIAEFDAKQQPVTAS